MNGIHMAHAGQDGAEMRRKARYHSQANTKGDKTGTNSDSAPPCDTTAVSASSFSWNTGTHALQRREVPDRSATRLRLHPSSA